MSMAMLKDKFKVSGDGVFYTLQGEGVSMGKPACFLRLHVCNLKCEWCDTRYTWDPNTKEFWTEGKDWTIDETKKNIESVWGCKDNNIKKRLVITGGEPLLQKEKIETLIHKMPEWQIEIETNGTIMPTPILLEHCQFNCSPKLGNSKNPKIARIKKEVLQSLNRVNASFKFVVTSHQDINEIQNDFITPINIDPNKVIIMPQGKTAEEVSNNAKLVVEEVKNKGYRLLGRLQCDIWGAVRGV